MQYKWNIVNIGVIVFILVKVIFTIANYDILAEGEGWGVVGIIGQVSIALVVLLIDFLFQLMFRKK